MRQHRYGELLDVVRQDELPGVQCRGRTGGADQMQGRPRAAPSRSSCARRVAPTSATAYSLTDSDTCTDCTVFTSRRICWPSVTGCRLASGSSAACPSSIRSSAAGSG